MGKIIERVRAREMAARRRREPPRTFIDVLRERSLLSSLPVSRLEALTGDVEVPPSTERVGWLRER